MTRSDAKDCLGWRQRQVADLVRRDGRSHREAALRLGVSEATVRRDLRCLDALASGEAPSAKRARLDARAQLRVALATWPNVDGATCAFLEGLPYRYRRTVELVYGEGYRTWEAGMAMGVCPRTMGRWLAEAHDAYAAQA